MRKIPEHLLSEARAEDIVSELDSGRVSLLASLGASRLGWEMIPVGWLCRFIIWLIFLRKKEKRRKWALRIVNFFFPTRVVHNACRAERVKDGTGVVVYFNHQSMFEVLATIVWCLTNFEKKTILFPVNVTWYEVLAPMRKKLSSVGVIIVPMLTPRTIQRVSKLKNADLKTAKRIKPVLEKYYFSKALDCILSGNVVALAPSATRTSTIFPSYSEYCCGSDKCLSTPRTMTALALSIQRELNRFGLSDEEAEIVFVPLVATRKGFRTKKLNPFLRHDVRVGEARTFLQVLELKKDDKLDFVLTRTLADLLPEEHKGLRYPLSTKPEVA